MRELKFSYTQLYCLEKLLTRKSSTFTLTTRCQHLFVTETNFMPLSAPTICVFFSEKRQWFDQSYQCFRNIRANILVFIYRLQCAYEIRRTRTNEQWKRKIKINSYCEKKNWKIERTSANGGRLNPNHNQKKGSCSGQIRNIRVTSENKSDARKSQTRKKRILINFLECCHVQKMI